MNLREKGVGTSEEEGVGTIGIKKYGICGLVRKGRGEDVSVVDPETSFHHLQVNCFDNKKTSNF